jgi:hypothetical protein
MDSHPHAYPAAIAHALQRQLGGSRQAVKTVMRWTGAGERTVKNWFAGDNGPSGRHLTALARHSDEVLAAFLALSGRQHVTTGAKLFNVRNKIAAMLDEIDLVLSREKS